MSDLLTGLPGADLTPQKARAIGELGRRLQAQAAAPAAAKPPSEKEIRAAHQLYCQAWADLRAGRKAEAALYHFDLRREFLFRREHLRALEQQIERIEAALGEAPPAAAAKRRLA